MIIGTRTDADKEAMFQFLRQKGARLFRSEDFQAIGNLNSSGKLVGVVGFNGFMGKSAQIHVAGEGSWVTREMIKQVFHYAFVQLKLNYLFGVVNSDNPKAIKFDLHIGFKPWQVIENGADDGVDLVILCMKRDECKWLEKREAA